MNWVHLVEQISRNSQGTGNGLEQGTGFTLFNKFQRTAKELKQENEFTSLFEPQGIPEEFQRNSQGTGKELEYGTGYTL